MGLDIFYRLGFTHLTAADAWDHQLFLATVALGYMPHRWRQWIALASFFAVGHSTALALLQNRLLPLHLPWVEPGIAWSIVAFALVEFAVVYQNPFAVRESIAARWIRYGLVLGFGVVHGLGFGATVVPLLGTDSPTSAVFAQLAAFTLGVEVAQLLLLAGMWLAGYLVLELVNLYPTRIRLGLLLVVALLGLRVALTYA